MTYRGTVRGGVVVFDQQTAPADGTHVTVETAEDPSAVPAPTGRKPTVGEVLMQFAGIMDGDDLPADGSVNHDHYIYGTPKR